MTLAILVSTWSARGSGETLSLVLTSKWFGMWIFTSKSFGYRILPTLVFMALCFQDFAGHDGKGLQIIGEYHSRNSGLGPEAASVWTTLSR